MSPQSPPTRAARLKTISDTNLWDILVIGGGASGLGAAVDAASRGYRTLLLDRNDFAHGTSSRSTKLVHGGVRYLQQLNLTLVLDALRERGYMLANAPHLVHKLNFVVPMYGYASIAYYGPGLKAYELLSGKLSFGRSELLSVKETIERLPTVRSANLKGGILYRDGQFDDARYAIALMRTLESLGGTALNYVAVTALLKTSGKLTGVQAQDAETGEQFDIQARAVINATGAFTQGIIEMDSQPGGTANAFPLALSQGSHFVLPRDFLPSPDALMIPRTDDGRVLFAIPWHEQLLVGTTDEAVPTASSNPLATPSERRFLADHIQKYLCRAITPKDVLTMWSGLRPLVRKGSAATAALSRDHQVITSPSGLISVVGGKWTTYRKMGEDTIARGITIANLAPSPSRTVALKIHGWQPQPDPNTAESDRIYGSDLPHLTALSDAHPALNELLHHHLPYRKREVIHAARHDQARTVEDVLARRTRALFLNAAATLEIAEGVSHLLAAELQRNETARIRDLENFTTTAKGYVYAI